MKHTLTGGNMDCTVAVNLAVDSERRIPSHAIEVAVTSPLAQGTGFCRLDHQVVAGIPGLNSGTGVDLAPESCKSLARFARVPIAVGCVLL